MMLELPAWWMAQWSQAQDGLRLGAGPFWSGRFLCGQPLFGAPELPYASPAAGMLLAWGPFAWVFFHSAVFAAGLAQWLRRDGAAAGVDPQAAAVTAMLVALALLLHPEAAVLLPCWAWLPWVLLLAGEAPAWVAAPVVALLACAASPLTLALGLVGSGWRRARSRDWRGAWALGLLMAAPAFLESMRQAGGQVSVALPGWPLAFLGSPLLVSQAVLALLTAFLLALGLGRKRPLLLLGPMAALLAFAPLLFSPRSNGHAAPPQAYVRGLTRHQAGPGGMPSGWRDLVAERWTGAAGGLAPWPSWLRWQRLSQLGLRDPDAISLAAVGWSDGEPAQRWFKPVPAAVVDSAVGYSAPPQAGSSLFERPLRLVGPGDAAPSSLAWHLLTPRSTDPGSWDMEIEPGGRGGWAFLSESFDPGWQAWGALGRQAVAQTEGGFMATQVQPSLQRLQWHFLPSTWRGGVFGAVLGLLLWLGLAKRGLGSLAH